MAQVFCATPGQSGVPEAYQCPTLTKGSSLLQALGGIDTTFVYYVELDHETVVVGVAPIQSRPPNAAPTLRMTENGSEPVFVLYIALRDDEFTDLTPEMLAAAKEIRTDFIYETPEFWDESCGKKMK